MTTYRAAIERLIADIESADSDAWAGGDDVDVALGTEERRVLIRIVLARLPGTGLEEQGALEYLAQLLRGSPVQVGVSEGQLLLALVLEAEPAPHTRESLAAPLRRALRALQSGEPH